MSVQHLTQNKGISYSFTSGKRLPSERIVKLSDTYSKDQETESSALILKKIQPPSICDMLNQDNQSSFWLLHFIIYICSHAMRSFETTGQALCTEGFFAPYIYRVFSHLFMV